MDVEDATDQSLRYSGTEAVPREDPCFSKVLNCANVPSEIRCAYVESCILHTWHLAFTTNF